MADYAVDFRTLAAESAWNQEALFDMFLHGISEEIKDELAAQELPTDLDSLIALTIRINEQRRERKFDFARTSRDSTWPPRHPGSLRRSRRREIPTLPDRPREMPKMAESTRQGWAVASGMVIQDQHKELSVLRDSFMSFKKTRLTGRSEYSGGPYGELFRFPCSHPFLCHSAVGKPV